jgi:hypothetical protein
MSVNMRRDMSNKVVEGLAASLDEGMGVRLLKEPKLLKGDDRVSFGELHVKLGWVSIRGQ